MIKETIAILFSNSTKQICQCKFVIMTFCVMFIYVNAFGCICVSVNVTTRTTDTLMYKSSYQWKLQTKEQYYF